MVLNGDWDWPGLYEDWKRKREDYYAAQKTLDDATTLFLEAKGEPPRREEMARVAHLRGQMFEARAAVNAFIEQHAQDNREKHNLPYHGG
jgi:hypothetical protein